jgi:serine/threonine protein kinase/formylglycine-generating enzyme required for sulfatase activity
MSATGNCIRCGRPADVMGLCQSCYDKRRSTSPASRSASGLLGGGRFRLVKPLGEGGMGSVWLAVDLNLSRGGSESMVALKFLSDDVARNPQALDWLRNEVMTAKSLAHPNVVRVYDWHEFDGEPIFYSMEYVAGLDLRAHLLANPVGRFTLAEVQRWLPEILSALSYCHHHRVYHRDLKPANLILTPEGRIRLVDFGLAQAQGAGEVRASATGLTRAYASPEQAMGNEGTAADDIYSLGAVLYHLLTGRLPASNATETNDPRSVIVENGGSAKDLSPEVALTILRCLDPDRTQRPASVDEFARWWRTGPADPGATGEEIPPTEGGGWLGKLLVACLVIGLGFLAHDRWGDEAGPGNTNETQRVAPPPPPPPPLLSNVVHRVPLQLRVPTSAGGSFVVGWSRWEQQTNVDGWTHSVASVAELPESGYFKTNLDLKPGTYRFTAQWTDRRLTNLSTTSWVTVGTNTGTVILSLLPPTLDLRLKAQFSKGAAGVVLSLVSESGQSTPLRLSDEVGDAFRLFHGEALPRILPGKYRIELNPLLREDWQVTEPAELEVPDFREYRATVVLLARRHVLIHRPWTNASHVYVPVSGRTNLLVCTTETTMDDFRAFVDDTRRPEVAFRRTGSSGETNTWRDALSGQSGDHPVVGVSWEDAMAHAAWLTETHRALKLLSDRQRYRLPLDSEWSLLTGGRTYPWGDHYPPASNEANLAGRECQDSHSNIWVKEWNGFLFERVLSGALTVAVSTGTTNNPFLQLGGNASEWVLDDYRDDLNPLEWTRTEVRALTARFGPTTPLKVVRGGSWFDGREYEFAEGPEKRLVGRRLLSTTRWAYPATHRNDRIGYRLVIVEE